MSVVQFANKSVNSDRAQSLPDLNQRASAIPGAVHGFSAALQSRPVTLNVRGATHAPWLTIAASGFGGLMSSIRVGRDIQNLVFEPPIYLAAMTLAMS